MTRLIKWWRRRDRLDWEFYGWLAFYVAFSFAAGMALQVAAWMRGEN